MVEIKSAQSDPTAASFSLDESLEIAFGLTSEDLALKLRSVLKFISDDFANDVRGNFITPQRFKAMVIIGLRPGQKQTEVADQIGIARSGMMIIVNALEKEGLVSRKPHDRDRRSYGLELTEKGKIAAAEFAGKRRAHNEKILGCLNSRDRTILFRLLSRVIA